MGKHLKSILVVLGIFILVIFIVDRLLLSPPSITPLTYTQFYNKVEQHQVKRVTIAGRDITGELSDSAQTKFSTTAPDDKDLLPTLRSNNVDVTAVNAQATPVWGLVLQFVPFIIMALLLIFILRQAQSGGSQALSFGRSRAKLLSENRPEGHVRRRRRASTKRKKSSARSSSSSSIRRNSRRSARASPRACCCSDRRAPARRCWPARSPARPAFRSSRSPARTSSRCSSASARRACATSSSRPRSPRPASSSSTRSTRSAASAAPAWAADTTSASRPSTSCSSRWTASIRTPASS